VAIGNFFRWLRNERKPTPLPDSLWQATLAGLPFIRRLSDDEQLRLKALTEAFLSEKEFTGAGGLELSDAMCISIAVQGCLPILNLGLQSYRNWVGLIIYPDEFIIPRAQEDEFGIVHEYDDVASGEAWEGGPLIISWRDAQMAGEGYNVVIHEFAHKLDMLNGEADGIPPLPAGLARQEWENTLLAAYDDFCTQVDAHGEYKVHDVYEVHNVHGQDNLIDPYASENPGEFFAVLSECFFETPELLYQRYPALYGLFVRFYQQDPISR
jgi:Mlc titration factor MtfA (ptsG expression regulator)